MANVVLFNRYVNEMKKMSDSVDNMISSLNELSKIVGDLIEESIEAEEEKKMVDNDNPDLYTLRAYLGKSWCGRNIYRYITRGKSGRPQINTGIGYNAKDRVIFKSEEQAKTFANRFASSKSRRSKYDLNWEVIKYCGTNESRCKVEALGQFDDEYGLYYTPKFSLR